MQTRLLFVCMGNICRSPAGECVMRKLVTGAGLDEEIFCDSAGTIDYHTGNSPDARMQAAGAARGIEIEGAARQVKRKDLDEFDLIIAMDHENYSDLEALAAGAETRAKIVSFCDYCTEHDEDAVPDPYYGGEAGFDKVLDLLEDGCSALLGKLQET